MQQHNTARDPYSDASRYQGKQWMKEYIDWHDVLYHNTQQVDEKGTYLQQYPYIIMQLEQVYSASLFSQLKWVPAYKEGCIWWKAVWTTSKDTLCASTFIDIQAMSFAIAR